jgi:hypothetical protein
MQVDGRHPARARLDDATEELTMLYADARGVHRMTFVDGVWTMWRDPPDSTSVFPRR